MRGCRADASKTSIPVLGPAGEIAGLKSAIGDDIDTQDRGARNKRKRDENNSNDAAGSFHVPVFEASVRLGQGFCSFYLREMRDSLDGSEASAARLISPPMVPICTDSRFKSTQAVFCITTIVWARLRRVLFSVVTIVDRCEPFSQDIKALL